MGCVDKSGIEDPFEIKLFIHRCCHMDDLIVAFVGCAYDHLCTLAGWDKAGIWMKLLQGKILFFGYRQLFF